MSNSWNGIYSAYMTAADGQGFAMLVFLDGVVSGTDAMGTLFDGSYEEDGSGTISGSIRVSIPGGGTVIQGASAGPAGILYDVPIRVSLKDLEADFIPISTPLGPVNLRLEKIRELVGAA
jgi:hypothetical protein